jgi:hypothetical protein
VGIEQPSVPTRGAGQVVAGGGLQRGRHLAHHRVVGPHVARRKRAQVGRPRARHQAAQADEAGVLARAVVVQRAGLGAGGGQRLDAAVVVGPVRAALQRCRIHAGLGQHAGGVARAGLAAVAQASAAAVRGAGQRQLGVGQAQRVGRAAGHQRQRLQHLARPLRGKTGRSMSPSAVCTAPSASTTASAPRWGRTRRCRRAARARELPLLLRDRAGIAAAWRLQWRHALVVAALGPAAYICVLYALQMAPLSHVAPARELSLLVAALVGGRLLGEADRGLRLAGAVCIAGGVMALAWN